MIMEWYGPLTILPAIGLIILSTAHFLVALNNEIYLLEKEHNHEWVIREKLKQLKRLGRANALLYASALLFLLSSLSKALFESDITFNTLMITATFLIALAFTALFIHSLKAISIRHKNLKV